MKTLDSSAAAARRCCPAADPGRCVKTEDCGLRGNRSYIWAVNKRDAEAQILLSRRSPIIINGLQAQ